MALTAGPVRISFPELSEPSPYEQALFGGIGAAVSLLVPIDDTAQTVLVVSIQSIVEDMDSFAGELYVQVNFTISSSNGEILTTGTAVHSKNPNKIVSLLEDAVAHVLRYDIVPLVEKDSTEVEVSTVWHRVIASYLSEGMNIKKGMKFTAVDGNGLPIALLAVKTINEEAGVAVYAPEWNKKVAPGVTLKQTSGVNLDFSVSTDFLLSAINADVSTTFSIPWYPFVPTIKLSYYVSMVSQGTMSLALLAGFQTEFLLSSLTSSSFTLLKNGAIGAATRIGGGVYFDPGQTISPVFAAECEFWYRHAISRNWQWMITGAFRYGVWYVNGIDNRIRLQPWTVGAGMRYVF